jgi:ssDNA-binding Zn-finger/Zn-ribbon topoisomerase 1
MSFYDHESFKQEYSKFQQFHTKVTLLFLLVLSVQAILYFIFPLHEIVSGYKLLIIIAAEIILYLAISKIYARKAGLKCPKCNGMLIYRSGLEVIKNRQCPHCKSIVTNGH